MHPAPLSPAAAAFDDADEQTARFFEAEPFAYEPTLDHLLIHNIHLKLSAVGLGASCSVRFVGSKGQVTVPTPKGPLRTEAIDLVLYLKGGKKPAKILPLQSKRLFPKSNPTKIPSPSGNLLTDIKAFMTAELMKARHKFAASSTYKAMRATSADPQWDAIKRLNALSTAAYGRDAIYYLLYNPWDPTLVGSGMTASANRLGCRVVDQRSIAAGGVTSVKPHNLNPSFSLGTSEFGAFVMNAIACGAGIPAATNTTAGSRTGTTVGGKIMVLTPGTQINRAGQVVQQAELTSGIGGDDRLLDRLVAESGVGIVDIRNCSSAVIVIDEQLMPDEGARHIGETPVDGSERHV